MYLAIITFEISETCSIILTTITQKYVPVFSVGFTSRSVCIRLQPYCGEIFMYGILKHFFFLEIKKYFKNQQHGPFSLDKIPITYETTPGNIEEGKEEERGMNERTNE